MPAPGDQYRDTKASINPFEEQIPRVNEYTAQEIATLQSKLDKQLGPEYISTRPGAGGGKVHYLAAEKVINLANEVFGFNGWSSAIQNVQIDFVDESPTSGKITLGLSIIVRVSLKDGTYHEDIGYGHIENCKGKAAAFEKAKKEAATDALKRALRNFGNVLGNCLYDKDYLSRVTKVKVAPSKWDAENLHRHPDFAPIKKEAIADSEATKTPAPRRLTSGHSAASNGTEFEDEFGGNLFDEVDFSHPDEVRLEANRTDLSLDTPVRQTANPAAAAMARQQVQRVQSMPQLRQGNVQPPQHPQHGQQPQRPQGPPRPPNNPQQVDNNQARMMPPPQHNNQVQRQRQPPQQGEQSGSRSNPSSAHDASYAGGQPSHASPISAETGVKKLTPPEQQARPNSGLNNAQQETTPHEPPVGFVTGRAAELLNAPPEARSGTVQAFNPHAESPSIRRTHGVNSGKSEPIRRTAISSAAPPPSGPPNAANGGGAMSRTNFVNPSADMSRRIGMPGGGMQSPMANRGAYKPPTAVKRPAPPSDANNARVPLADMSNMQQLDGANDPKKVKVEAAPKERENQLDGAVRTT